MGSELITIYEDYQNFLPSYREHLPNLYCLKDIIKSNNFSLQADGVIKVQHYVGFFQKGNTRLQILPKVYAKSGKELHSSNEAQISLEFIYRLLYWSGFLNVKKLSPQTQSSSGMDLLEIFIEIFIDEFINLFQKVIYQKYELQEENQQFIKGKILFPETIKYNPFQRHLHFIRFDEFTINNPLNQIFKALLLSLLVRTNSSYNKKKIVIGLTYLQEVDPVNLTVDIFRKVKFDRITNVFQPLFNLAKLFFHNVQPGLTEGSERTFSFLVPVHLLFQNFIWKILEDFSDDHYKFGYQGPIRYYGLQENENIFPLQPDFTVWSEGKYLCILDAKYKYPFDKNGKPTIDVTDLYQLSTYAISYNCRSLVLIYPRFVDAPNPDTCLTEYKLMSAMGDIYLKIIQIDIMERDLSIIRETIRKYINLSILKIQL